MTRAVVCVATNGYEKWMGRLAVGMEKWDPVARKDFWMQDPPGCPSHRDKPYAFKAYALKESSLTADLLLWCDSSIVPIGSLDPLWDRIEREGYWFARNGWTNYQWTAESAYADLFTELPLDIARERNKAIPHVVATAFGVNVKHPKGKGFLQHYFALAQTNAFCGPWRNTPETPCGPADVLGHRHDQTAASVIAWRLDFTLTTCPEIFSYPPPADSTILLADGGMTYGA